MSYICPLCRMTSHNPNDERERYCVRCHRFEDELVSPGAPRPRFYVLRGDKAIPEPNVTAWAKWFEQATDRLISIDHLVGPAGEVTVTTIFLGYDMALSGDPKLFVTLGYVPHTGRRLDSPHESAVGTYGEAREAHERMIEAMRAVIGEPRSS